MRILVIEDEARIQSFLARGLEAEGYVVDAAGDGRDGLALRAPERVGPRRARPAPAGARTACACSRELHRERPELPVADPLGPRAICRRS